MRRLAWPFLLYLIFTPPSGPGYAGEALSPKARPDSTARDSKAAVKSPVKAVFFSAVFPGGGQIYTRNYWRAAVLGTVEASLAGAAMYEVWRMNKATDQAEVDRHFEKQRSLWWWTAGVGAFSMADAYVDAHLCRFDEQGRITIQLRPMGGMGLALNRDL
jgi:hypothetical protein